MLRIQITLCTLIALLLTACASTSSTSQESRVDQIVVKYGPVGELDQADMVTVTVDDARTIGQWLEKLDAIPEMPERGIRYVKFLPTAPRYRLEFIKDGEIVDVHRMRGAHLDVQSHEGWAFYSGEDREFCQLVTELVPGS